MCDNLGNVSSADQNHPAGESAEPRFAVAAASSLPEVSVLNLLDTKAATFHRLQLPRGLPVVPSQLEELLAVRTG